MTDKTARKECPVARGVLDYFPDAVAAVANVSYVGNQQHNPGEEMHWAREKSRDHADCIARHLMERGTLDDDGLRHTAKVAWRALALLQTEIEEAQTKAEQKVDRAFDDSVRPVATARHLSAPESADTLRVVYPSGPRLPADLPAPSDRQALVRGLTEAGCLPSVAHVIAGGYFLTSNTERINGKTPLVYLAGPMRGIEDFNFPAFDAHRDGLLATGFDVISPADIDRTANDSEHATQIDFAYRDFHALHQIACFADGGGGGIALMPGWEDSTGARAEHALAVWLGLKVYHLPNL